MSSVNVFAYRGCFHRNCSADWCISVCSLKDARPEDDGDQTLMRGLDTAFPFMRLGAIPVLLRASAMPATKRPSGIPQPMALRPSMNNIVRASQAGVGMLRRAISHMNPTISLATAVVATVDFLPRRTSWLYRRVNRVCAFHAMSLISGDTFRCWSNCFSPTRGAQR